MQYLVIDVCYTNNEGHVAGVLFTADSIVVNTFFSTVKGVAEYKSGEFYKRELPCIEKLISEHELNPDCIIVDGYVYLEGGKAGLGKYLFDSINGHTPIIGVAKNARGEAKEEHKVFRGESLKPLYVTCEGLELENAKTFIKHLAGPHRLPTVIKLADRLCRN